MNKQHFDVIVCGAGPAGVSAAISAGRKGLRTLLIENGGALGGVWTSGMLCLILDVGSKAGLSTEIRDTLAGLGSVSYRFSGPSYTYDVESMKYVLEQLCSEAGVQVRLHTRVTNVTASGRLLQAVITESCQGCESFTADRFVDATGNGDVAARAGCSYEMGHPLSGQLQPATLFGIVSGVPEKCLTSWRYYHANGYITKEEIEKEKEGFRQLLHQVGVEPSYQAPTLFPLPQKNLYCLMIHHAYGVRCDSADQVSAATIQGRKELYETVQALRSLPDWEQLALIATADHVGIREGRRIHGRYRMTMSDLMSGARFEDGICLVEFGVDVHALEPGPDKAGYSTAGVETRPYHIPYRALVSSDYDNLAMAGRCISGDFFAHASYRVTGNAVAMGEAVGLAAALAKHEDCTFAEIDGKQVAAEMVERGYRL